MKLKLNLPKKNNDNDEINSCAFSIYSNRTEITKKRKSSESNNYIKNMDNEISSPNSSQRNFNKFKKIKIFKNKKQLEEVDEVYEEIEHLYEHSKKALKHLFKLWLKIIHKLFSTILSFVFDIISLVTKCFKYVFVFFLYLFLKFILLVNKIIPKKHNPFKDMIKYNKLMLIDLNKNYKKIALILDLDKTLIYCNSLEPKNGKNYKRLVIGDLQDNSHIVYLHKRPHLDEFLKELSKYYNLFIYTKSISEYADIIIDEIDKNNLIIKRFCRDSCVKKDGKYYKDISLLKLEKYSSIILDNTIDDIIQKDKVIRVEDFIGDEKDNELEKLKNFLVEIWKNKSFEEELDNKTIINEYNKLNN